MDHAVISIDTVNNDKLKRILTYISAPLIIIVYMLVIYKIYGLYPFGTKSVSLIDMSQQGVPMYNNFKDILAGKSSMFLNFQNAGGMNFYGVIFSFFLNPLNYLLVFVPKSEVIVFMNIMLILNMALCAFAAICCFNYIYKSLDNYSKVFLSVMYPLSGYVLMYYQNIGYLGFLNAAIIFPILIIGIYRLIKEQKPLLFIITITVSLLFGFYFSYMIAVGILIFIGIYYIRNRRNKDHKHTYLYMTSGAIIALMISCISWLPALLQTAKSGRINDKGLFGSVTNSFLSPYTTAVPMLFCLSFVAVIVIYDLVFYKKTRSELHTLSLIMLAVMTIPFFIEPINKMWHGGQYMSFPCRFGYITIFLGLICAGNILESVKGSDSIKNINIFTFFAGLICFAIFCCYKYTANVRLKNIDNISRYVGTLWGNQQSFDLNLTLFIVTACAYLLIWFGYCKQIIPKKIMLLFAAIIFIIESHNNINIYVIYAANSRAAENAGNQKSFKLADRIQDKQFYRVKSSAKFYNNNHIGELGYSTIAHYSSLNNKTYMYTMKKLGYTTVWMETGATGGTRLTDALLSIRYYINKQISGSEKVYKSNAGSIYKLPDYLPMGLLLKQGALDGKEEIPADMDRIDIQKYVSQTVFDEDLVTRYMPDNKQKTDDKWIFKNGESIKYSINLSDEQTLYADCFDKFSNATREAIFASLDIYANGQKVSWSYPNGDWNGVERLGDYANQTVIIEVKVKKDISCTSFGIFGIDNGRLRKLCDQAAGVNLTIKRNGLAGSCRLESPKTCFVSLPYQDNFKIKINGKKVKYNRAFTGFICFDVPVGQSNISIMFVPGGFKIGLIFSVLGIALLCLFIKYKDMLTRFDKASEITVLFGSAFVFACVYVIPVIAKLLKT